MKAFHTYVGLDGQTIAVWRPPGRVDPLGVGTVHFAESQAEVDGWMPFLRRGERPPELEPERNPSPYPDQRGGNSALLADVVPEPDPLLDSL